MRSFRASPVPSASQIRPGANCSSVAAACATKAGCWRSIGQVTMPRVNALCTASAPAHTQLWPDCPCAVVHGWKWSEHIKASNPACSARSARPSKVAGGNCSCDAW